jgi:hypothetical protein
MNDFTKFSVFVKGTLITAEVIKNSGKLLRNDMRMHFNRILNDCSNFEKYLHQQLGPELAEMEDEVNSLVVDFIWKLYDMPSDEREKFMNYINDYQNDKAVTGADA